MSVTTATNLSLKQLKKRVTIRQVLDAYGLCSSLRQRAGQLYGPCPLHHGDNPTAFRVHTTRGIWHCFTACGGGDVVDLIRVIEHCSCAEAARYLQALAHVLPIPEPVLPAASPLPAPEAFRPFRPRITLNHSVPFLQENKRISVQTAARFEAGRAVRSTWLRGTVAVRLHDLHGHPLGYCGRRLNHEHIRRFGKWRFPRGLHKRQLLYNAHRALPLRNNGIVVVECPWAVMRLTQAGCPAAVALLGTALSDTQAKWLSAAPSILLLLDGDPVGRSAQRLIRRRLAHLTATAAHYLPDGLEPEDLPDQQLTTIVRASLPSL
jgi:DNA primase